MEVETKRAAYSTSSGRAVVKLRGVADVVPVDHLEPISAPAEVTMLTLPYPASSPWSGQR